MKKWNLTGRVTVSVYTTVEAETLDQAIEIAEQRHIERNDLGDENFSNEAWLNEEYDGEVQGIELE